MLQYENRVVNARLFLINACCLYALLKCCSQIFHCLRNCNPSQFYDSITSDDIYLCQRAIKTDGATLSASSISEEFTKSGAEVALYNVATNAT